MARTVPARVRALVRDVMRGTGARLGLLHIQKVMRGMHRRGVDLTELRALEVFGYTGERLAKHYAPRVRSLDVWELDPRFEPVLRRNVPSAAVKITDSYEEIKRTSKKFDLVVIDNFITPREHFDLFPAVFRVLSDDATVVMIVVPGDGKRSRSGQSNIFGAEHLQRRSDFYCTDSPGGIPLDELAARYGSLAQQHGLVPEWHFFVPRSELKGVLPRKNGYYDLVLKLKRPAQAVRA